MLFRFFLIFCYSGNEWDIFDYVISKESTIPPPPPLHYFVFVLAILVKEDIPIQHSSGSMYIYEEESVNRSQIDIKRKTCDIQSWKKTFISRHVLHQHWYTCPIALPMRRNLQHRSLMTVVSATSAPAFQPLRHQRNVCHISGLICDMLYATHTSHRKQETFLYEYHLHWVLLPKKKRTNNTAIR
jgi:hypothetical protein